MKKHKRDSNPFAEILVRLMDEKKIGVREAARLAGVGPSTVMSWRSGALPENYIAVKKLAQGLGTTLSFLLTGEHDPAKGVSSSATELFKLGDTLFDGYAKITIQKVKIRGEED